MGWDGICLVLCARGERKGRGRGEEMLIRWGCTAVGRAAASHAGRAGGRA